LRDDLSLKTREGEARDAGNRAAAPLDGKSFQGDLVFSGALTPWPRHVLTGFLAVLEEASHLP
jgi:hypothetical protein